MLSTIVSALLLVAPQWTIQRSNVTARLRGVSAVNNQVAWASGSDSTVLRTEDGGSTWNKLTVTSDKLDFRDIDAIDERTAYVLAIGNGEASRIYKTTDAGATWTLQFKNTEAKAFYDAMSFWDANHGIVIGDSIAGEFCILITDNGGRTWNSVPGQSMPAALPNEGAFAASGTNIAVWGSSHAWIATGGAAKSRVLRTSDRGRTWKVVDTPLKAGASTGIFSIDFSDARHGVIVGGDYSKESEAVDNLAVTNDGGITWSLRKGLSGYRSVVAYVPDSSGNGSKNIVAVGPSGSDYSNDEGLSWQKVDGPGFDTLSFVRRDKKRGPIGWAAGKDGAIGKLLFR
jgi:photosystem II stability/assembly factor-like uncharacterized protein